MKKLILVLLFTVLATSVHAKKFAVEDCDSSSIEDINWAVDFIDKNIDQMLSEATFIPSKYGDEIKKKWPKSTLKCSTKKKCDNTKNTLGYHRGGNKINLCWDTIRDTKQTRCDLVGIIMHEKAHAADVPIEKKHNDVKEYSYVSKVDLVYRFDEVVERICLVKNGMGAVPATPKTGGSTVESGGTIRLDLGQFCSTNTQCGSNNCGAGGVCVCDDDKDCGSGSRCKKRIGKNYCVPTGGDLGDYCEKNSDCGMGKCEKKSCVCEKDKDCRDSFGSTDFRCGKPGLGFGKNFCQATSVPIGSACERNSDCKSDNCKKDRCEAK
jgi:hypothetical protein